MAFSKNWWRSCTTTACCCVPPVKKTQQCKMTFHFPKLFMLSNESSYKKHWFGMQRNKRSFLYPKSWLDRYFSWIKKGSKGKKKTLCNDALRVRPILLCIGNSCIHSYYVWRYITQPIVYTFPTKVKGGFHFTSNIFSGYLLKSYVL